MTRPCIRTSSNPMAVGLHLFIEQVDKFFEQVEILCAGDGVDLLEEAALPFDHGGEVLDAGRCQGTAGALERNQLVDFLRAELARALGMTLNPGLQLRLGGLLVETAKLIVARHNPLMRATANMPIHPDQKLLHRPIAKLADR